MEEFIPYNKWLHQHDDDIRQEFPDKPTTVLAGKIGVHYYTVSRRATRMGVSKSEKFMHASWKKGAKKSHTFKGKLRTAIVSYMKEHFADTKNEELATLFSVDIKTVRRWARKLGLVKSEEFMRSVRERGGNHYYTDEQKEWRNRRIREVYPEANYEELRALAQELGVKVQRVYVIARELGIRKEKYAYSSKYTKVIEPLREYYPDHSNEECAKHFGLPIVRIVSLAQRYGLKKSKEHLSKMHCQRQRRKWNRPKNYSRKLIEALREYYPNHTNKECAKRFGIPEEKMSGLAFRHGIKKSKEHLSLMSSIKKHR